MSRNEPSTIRGYAGAVCVAGIAMAGWQAGCAPSAQAAPVCDAAGQAAAPVDPASAYDKGAALAAAGKLREARVVFDAAARADPGDGSLAAALAMFQDVDQGRVPVDVVQRIFRALEQASAQRWKDAHADADEALKRAPQYARAYATKAALHVSQEQYPQAIKALDQALALDPRFAEGYYNRGAVRAELNQIDGAIADYGRAIELQPSYWYAYRNRGSAYTHKRNPQAAIADYTKALELRPIDVETRLLRAVVNMAIQRWDASLPDLDKVIELEPGHAPALYHRGLVHEQKGDVVRAKADYAAAIKSDTTGQVAAAARQRLGSLEAKR